MTKIIIGTIVLICMMVMLGVKVEGLSITEAILWTCLGLVFCGLICIASILISIGIQEVLL